MLTVLPAAAAQDKYRFAGCAAREREDVFSQSQAYGLGIAADWNDRTNYRGFIKSSLFSELSERTATAFRSKGPRYLVLP